MYGPMCAAACQNTHTHWSVSGVLLIKVYRMAPLRYAGEAKCDWTNWNSVEYIRPNAVCPKRIPSSWPNPDGWDINTAAAARNNHHPLRTPSLPPAPKNRRRHRIPVFNYIHLGSHFFTSLSIRVVITVAMNIIKSTALEIIAYYVRVSPRH